MTGHYNASYSFYNEIEGTSNDDILFVDYGSVVGNVWSAINSTYLGHDKVIHFYDYDATGGTRILAQHESFSQVSGTYEFWLLCDSNSDIVAMHIYDDVTVAYSFYMRDNGQFAYYDGVYTDLKPYSANVWYHIRFDFETGAGGYMGLGADEFDLYINGILEADDISFRNPVGALDMWNIMSSATPTDYSFYLDAMGFDWLSNYTMEENIMPYHYEDNSSIEIDKYDFNIKAVNDDFSGSVLANTQGWTSSYIGARMNYGNQDGESHEIQFQADDMVTRTSSLYQDFDLDDNRFNVTWEVVFVVFNDWSGDEFEVRIPSKDETLLTEINIFCDSTGQYLRYYDGAVYQTLQTGLNQDDLMQFNFGFGEGIGYLTFLIDGVYEDSWVIPLIDDSKTGLGTVRVNHVSQQEADPHSYSNVFLEYIGVYAEGISQFDDGFGYYTYYLEDYLGSWDFQTYNLINITANGTFYLAGSEGIYDVGTSGFGTICTFDNYNFTSRFFNVYDVSTSDMSNPFLILYLRNNVVTYPNITSLNIEGIVFEEGTNEYYPTYDNGNIINNESFWFATNGYLRYTLTVNDNNTEYILIDINVDDEVTYSRSFLYIGYNYNQFGREIRIDYQDYTTGIYNVTYGFRTERVYLPSQNILMNFEVVITDNDLYDSYNGIGYFRYFILRPSSEHDISVATSTLLTALTPLLFVILLPSFIITYSFKKVGKDDDLRGKVLLPVITLFTMVAFWFAEIELWMFFLMLLGFGVLFYLQRD
ncbi:MAG: hypothetical protein ACW981_21085 [Candidatus Hodarchaeales archaeon]